MKRADLGAWGLELDRPAFAAALAALGVAPADLAQAGSGAPLHWHRPASPPAPAPVLAETWTAAVENLHAPGLRLAVELEPGEDPTWLIDRLNAAPGLVSAFVATAPPPDRRGWSRPLEVGLLDDRASRRLAEQIDQPRAARPIVLGPAGGACDVLLLARPLRAAATAVLALPIRAGAILVMHPPGERWPLTEALVRSLQADTGAGAVGFCPVPVQHHARWATALVESLAHDVPLDVALRLAADEAEAAPPLLLADAALLEVTRPARVADAPAFDGAARFIHAQVRETGPNGPVVMHGLAPDTVHAIGVRVAGPDPGWAAGNAAFPDATLPAGSQRLTVVLTEPDLLLEPLVDEIVLPAAGPSTTCWFHLRTGAAVNARLTVLHQNRILETATLTAAPGEAVRLETETVVRLRLDDLEHRRDFDAAVFATSDGGLTTHLAGRAEVLTPAGFEEGVARLRDRLEEAVLEPAGFDGLRDEATRRLPISLANQGERLHDAFARSFSARDVLDADRLQLVLVRDGADFPLEFLYDREPPNRDAELCPHAEAALADGVCRPGCPSGAEHVCPLGFWGLSKAIERAAFDGPPPNFDLAVLAEPVSDRERLAAPDAALFATSEKVAAADVERLEQALAPARRAASWDDWRSAVADDHPPLLVLLPHTLVDDDLGVSAMEVGGDLPLGVGHVKADVVCPSEEHHPLVVLLGCNTAAAEVAYQGFPGPFKQSGAAIVVGTLTKVLGRHAAAVAGQLAQELRTKAAGKPAYFPEVVRDLRRALLAAGQPFGLTLVAYGDGDERHHVVIDGGPPYAREPLQSRLGRAGGHVELLVISHVDFDHVGGIVSLLADPSPELTVGDVWFNGWDHLPGPDDQLGAVQGEMVSAAIEQAGLPWNEAFGGGAVAGDLVTHTLPGGLALTLLSPSADALARLRPRWEREVRAEGMTPGDFEDALRKLREREGLPDDVLGDEETDPEALVGTPFRSDTSLANASSIALLAEYDGRAALLAADAIPPHVQRAVETLCARRGLERLPLDALKLSHHGSKGSTSAELLDNLACPRYLVSTNGKIFRHPAREAIARVILHGGEAPELLFNYRTPQNAVWDDDALRARHGYTTTYGEGGLRVEL